MTHIHKALIATIAAVSLTAFAQSTSSGSAPAGGSTTGTSSTTSSSTTNSVGTMPTNSTMNNVPPTNSDGTATSTTTTNRTTSSSTTTGTGSRDPAMIRQAQQALIDKGISTGGPVDGFWGTRSTSALREFQRQQNLPITGQLDSQTASALGLSGSGFSPGTTSNDTAPGMQNRQGRSPSDVIDDTAPMDNTTPGTGRSPSDSQQR